MKDEDIEERFNELAGILVQEINPDGFWTGKLSSSALGVSVAIAALHFYDKNRFRHEIKSGLIWLQNNVNGDGSFGDSPESPGNISTSLLVYAAINLYVPFDVKTAALQKQIGVYLNEQGIEVNTPNVAKVILAHYQKDYTFSVPILTLCGLCGIPGPEAFKYIPQLPFELALLPRKFYRMLNLSVVSYAIPALIAVGIVVFRKKKSTLFSRWIRKRTIRRSLQLLEEMMPQSGGFLEAIPLTAFVVLSLTEAGYRHLSVVEKGINFLKQTQREDGSWPIDIDLSTWVTTLAVESLRNRKDQILTPGQQSKVVIHLKNLQNKTVHPFNGSAPGGFGWTNYSGSVPDGDDTPGAIMALLRLGTASAVKQEVLKACQWMFKLQNSDGGLPTFSKGWGKLPFDQSCSDLTGHGLVAVSATLDRYQNELATKDLKDLKKGFNRMSAYLQQHQQTNGSWLPLWFGNQLTFDHTNPVYGTAKVMTYLHDTLTHQWLSSVTREMLENMIRKGTEFLLQVQNDDGSWGGNKNIPGTIEETALAVSALSGGNNLGTCLQGLIWLDHFYTENGLISSPIGLYFASLWYDEKLYPLTAYMEALARMQEVLHRF